MGRSSGTYTLGLCMGRKTRASNVYSAPNAMRHQPEAWVVFTTGISQEV